jgi:O-antigen/teichoic acid export membrane protein
MVGHALWYDQSNQTMVAIAPSDEAPALQQRMVRAAAWLIGSNVASQGLRLISSLVLTRLLVPESFGLMAAVQTMYFALVMFSDLGVWQSVVSHPQGAQPKFLGTAFSVQLARGVLLAVIVALIALGLQLGVNFSAFKAGTVYADARLPGMVLVFALSALLQGAESMHIATAQRALQTRLLTRLELLTQLAGMLVTIACAYWTHSVWSLLAGTVTATLSRTLLSHTLFDGPPYKPCWDRSSLKDILGFGKWIFLSSIIGFVAANGEKIVLGGTLSAHDFGVFSIASLLLAAIVGLVGNLNAHLVFPSLSEALREGDAAAQKVYSRVQQIADAILGSIAGLTLVLGSWVVHLLYDARYAEGGWMLQLLAMNLVAMRYQVLEQMMFARNRPGWVTLSNALRAICLVLLVPIGYSLGGVQGAIAGVVVSQFAGWPVAIIFKIRLRLMSWKSEVVWPSALLFGGAIGAVAHQILTLLTT